MKTKITFIVLLCLHGILAFAQWGMLDTTFDTDGKKVISFATPNDYGQFVLIQPDSKIIVGGQSSLTGGYASFSLARLQPDGSFDNTFGTQGKVTTSYGTDGFEAVAAALQTDGKIVVTGNAFTNASMGYSQIVVVRYHSDGSLDTSFDSDGMVFTQIPTSNEDFAKAVKIQPDGKIVVGVQSRINFDRDYVLLRYNADGSPDNSFGSNGTVRTLLPTTNEAIYDIALQNDGKIIAAGTISGTSNDDLAVFRYNADGALDTSFAVDGKFIYDFASAHNYVFGVALTSESKIVLVGRYQNGSITSPFVARLNTNGTFDDSFATNGMLIQTTDEMPNDVFLQSDDKIIVVGTSNLKFGVWKLNTDGTFDNTFGTNGKVETLVSTVYSMGNQGALQPDGKIVVVGSTFGNPFMKYGVVRYTNDAPLHITENSKKTCALFPNPVGDHLSIESSEVLSKIEIINSLGQTVYSENSNTMMTTIPMASQVSGIYFVRVQTEGNNEQVFKIIKQ